MQRNTGKELESLVQRLEELLLPRGFELVANRRVVDLDGVQLAEFDIEIRGRRGHRSIHWLIECRDRPSDGAAPSAWIEQLVGRRAIHHLDQVIAVSTTGFAEPARRLAERTGIVLRHVDAITDLAADFKVVGFCYLVCLVTLKTIDVDAEGLGGFDFHYRDLFVRPADDSAPQRFADFVCKQMNHLPADVEEYTQRVNVVHDGPIELRLPNLSIMARGFRADVEVTQRVITGEAIAAKRYSEDNRLIGQEGLFTWVIPEGSFQARVSVVDRDDGTQTVHVAFLGALPETWQRTALEFYGKNFHDLGHCPDTVP